MISSMHPRQGRQACNPENDKVVDVPNIAQTIVSCLLDGIAAKNNP
jgi:hypothetical protein